MAAVACFGEILLRLGPADGASLRKASSLDVHVGGAEANVAVGLSQLGHDVRMISALPVSPLGDLAHRAIASEGVNLEFVARRDGRMGLYFLDPGAALRPPRVTYDRTGSVFATADEDLYRFEEALGGVELCHLGGISPALGLKTESATCTLIRTARELGCRLSFDCNYRATLWQGSSRGADQVLPPLVSQADILFANRRDAETLVGSPLGQDDPREFADALFAAFAQLEIVISTERIVSQAGEIQVTARLDRRGGFTTSGPQSLVSQIGRIGSGDAFAAGVLSGILNGDSDSSSLESGLRLMAIKQATRGDFPDHRQDDISGPVSNGIER